MTYTISELAEAVEEVSTIYAEKFDIDRDDIWFLLKLQEEVGELTQAFLAMSGRSRTRDRSADELKADFRQEVADVLCQTLLLAHRHGLDLESEIEAKWLAWRRV